MPCTVLILRKARQEELTLLSASESMSVGAKSYEATGRTGVSVAKMEKPQRHFI